MSSNVPEQTPKLSRNEVQIAARKALLQLLEPLVRFVLDSGLSLHELHSILREAAVRIVAAGQKDDARRINISGIAASTGIPRAEISRILKSKQNSLRNSTDRQQQSTNRILAVWHQDPRFTTSAGKPADLRIYGRGATFEALVKSHGRGIPIRAMLDELIRAGAAELVSLQTVRVKAAVVVDRGMTPRAIRSFGDRATELLSTMLQNMKNPDSSHFVASVAGTNVSNKILPLFRKELATKGADFLADIHDALHREVDGGRIGRRRSQGSKIGVTIFYHEAQSGKRNTDALKKRRNLRRGS